jgi:hypothetical protein
MYTVMPRVQGLRVPCNHDNDCGRRSPARQLINQIALSMTVDGITHSGKAFFSGCASIPTSVPSRVFN